MTGGTALTGRVRVTGAKNSALKLMAAALLAPGLTTIEEFTERSGYVIPEGPYDTVAGYFMTQLGRVPEMGDAITVDLDRDRQADSTLPEQRRYRLTVNEVDGRRVAWLEVSHLSADEATADDATAADSSPAAPAGGSGPESAEEHLEVS